MLLQVYNLSGAAILDKPGVPPLAAHANVQTFAGLDPGQVFSFAAGPCMAQALKELKDAGDIDYQIVPEARDYGCVGVKKLVVDFDRGHFTGIAETTNTFTDDVALPEGAVLINAKLIVHTVLSGGSVSAAVVASGVVGSTSLLDASENVFAGATERALTAGTVASAISGKKLTLALTLTDDDIENLEAGKLELVVTFVVAPVI